jgi:predicted TIM-barrel fold metal-dependent hydrolase
MSEATRLPRAIDTFVNINMGSMARPPWLVRVAEDYFKRPDAIFKDVEMGELIDDMDRLGVERSVISTSALDVNPKALAFAAAHPDRFVLSVSVDPRSGMQGVRALEALAKNEPVVLARVIPFMVGVPLDDRIYYPVYAKCSEMGLPISVNTGIPGPPAPARTQDPLLLDEVCLFFPDLTVIMAHGADPWWNVAIRLMLKYRNLYLMTSAFAPKYFPQELITFMNTRGKEKILFASDHPVLSMERTVNEAREMTTLKPGVLEKFLYDNAWKVLFEKRFGPSTPQG